jgi:hypothetical protein
LWWRRSFGACFFTDIRFYVQISEYPKNVVIPEKGPDAQKAAGCGEVTYPRVVLLRKSKCFSAAKSPPKSGLTVNCLK